MNAKEKIYQLLVKSDKKLQASAISKKAKVGDRSYTSRLLAELIAEKRVASEKIGREIFYWSIDEQIILE